ncbi:hypothetical protein ES708_14978 [subsurface metagenome]
MQQFYLKYKCVIKMKRTKSVLLIMMMAFSALSVAIIPLSAGSSSMSLPEYIPMDIGPELRATDADLNLEILGTQPSSSSMGPSSAAQIVGAYIVGPLLNHGSLG